MNTRFLFLIAFIFITSCTFNTKLATETKVFNSHSCDSCAHVEVKIPHVIDTENPLAKGMLSAFTEEVIFTLDFAEESTSKTIEEAITNFTNSYQEISKEFKDEQPWEASVTAEIIFEDEFVLSTEVTSYLFTGGAHGLQRKNYMNFDKKLGTEIDFVALLKDENTFTAFLEKRFRKQYKIPETAGINASGFMFENDIFKLPEQIGINALGVICTYNTYEIASYVDGEINIQLSFSEIAPYLKTPLQNPNL